MAGYLTAPVVRGTVELVESEPLGSLADPGSFLFGPVKVSEEFQDASALVEAPR